MLYLCDAYITNKPVIIMRAIKLWLAFVAASLVSMGAMAQGIHVGYVQSRFSTAIGDGAPSKSEAMNGFEAGFDQTFKIAKGIIAVDYGLNYTYLASEAASAEAGDLMSVSGRMKNHYLDIPVHLQIGVPILGVVRVFAYGGPKFIVGLSSKTTVDMDVAGTSTTVTYNHYSGKVTAPGLSDDELGNASDDTGTFKRFDIMMGVVCCNEKAWPKVFDAVTTMGQTATPDDVYVAYRGLHTMKARIEAAFENAKLVVDWLQNRPEVERVLWPVLESHPDHAIFKRDFTGGTTLFSVVFKPEYDSDKSAFTVL